METHMKTDRDMNGPKPISQFHDFTKTYINYFYVLWNSAEVDAYFHAKNTTDFILANQRDCYHRVTLNKIPDRISYFI